MSHVRMTLATRLNEPYHTHTQYITHTLQNSVGLLHIHIGWLWVVGYLKIYVSSAEYGLFYRALLKKKPAIFGSLLIVATSYHIWMRHAAQIDEPYHTRIYVTHVYMSHTYICHTRIYVTHIYMSHTYICHARIYGPHVYMSHTYIWHARIYITPAYMSHTYIYHTHVYVTHIYISPYISRTHTHEQVMSHTHQDPVVIRHILADRYKSSQKFA